MKHAFIVTAYHNFDMLQYFLTEYLKESDCYLHIDKKARVPSDFLSWIQDQQKKGAGLYVSRRYKINWGSHHHLSAVLSLCQTAVTKKYDFYHIISGNTFITRPLKEVFTFFEATPHVNYMDVRDLNTVDTERIMDPWFIYYRFLHFYKKKSTIGNNIDWYLCKIQKKLRICRKKRYQYHGSLYGHYTAECIHFILEYHQAHPEYYRNLITCNIPEEFFFQNILMCSSWKNSIVPRNYIYSKWTQGGVAEDLTEQDYAKIRQEDCLFARKFGTDSLDLLNMLQLR